MNNDRTAQKRNRKANGQCFIEMAVGSMIMIPVMLYGLDIIAVGLSVSVNDHLAKEAARVAAVQTDSHAARMAAETVISRLKKSAIITNASITSDGFNYNDKDRVTVKTELYVRVPAPLPFLEGTKIYARAVEPIVANPVDYQKHTL